MTKATTKTVIRTTFLAFATNAGADAAAAAADATTDPTTVVVRVKCQRIEVDQIMIVVVFFLNLDVVEVVRRLLLVVVVET